MGKFCGAEPGEISVEITTASAQEASYPVSSSCQICRWTLRQSLLVSCGISFSMRALAEFGLKFSLEKCAIRRSVRIHAPVLARET